jgi:hypothetical protein
MARPLGYTRLRCSGGGRVSRSAAVRREGGGVAPGS